MKAILNFDFDNVDDMQFHKRCIKSTDMAILLWDIKYNLTRKIISNLENNTEKCYEEAMIEELNTLFEENNIIIDELIN